MHEQFNLKEFVPQSVRCLKIIRESYDFFMENKLWRGIFRHKWIVLVTVVLSVIFTFTVLSNLYDFFFEASEIAQNIDGQEGGKTTKEVNRNTAIFGGSKFLLLIMLEIVIFHFSVKTLEVLNNEKYETNFNMFFKAEVRMIKVMVRSTIQSFIAQILIGIAFWLVGMSDLVALVMFVVHGYFIGLAFFDNYNEQQKLNIKESDICIRHNSGAATTLGVIASIGLMIPIIGPLVVPIFGAITANIYGFRYHIENPPDHVSEKVEEEAEVSELV